MAQAVDYEKLYSLIGYRFRNEKLIKTALTHSSYASEHKLGYERNNERLEFIGDAYVDAVVGAKLFEIMGSAHEGILSRCRADVVCEDSLAGTASEMGLGEFLYLGKGEEASGGRNKASILADAFEALVGAIILDGGYEAGRDIILRLLEDRIVLGAQGKLNKDFNINFRMDKLANGEWQIKEITNFVELLTKVEEATKQAAREAVNETVQEKKKQ